MNTYVEDLFKVMGIETKTKLPMRYLITYLDYRNDPFYTNWFDYESHFEEGMMVFDLSEKTWTRNGIDWMNIAEDHL